MRGQDPSANDFSNSQPFLGLGSARKSSLDARTVPAPSRVGVVRRRETHSQPPRLATHTAGRQRRARRESDMDLAPSKIILLRLPRPRRLSAVQHRPRPHSVP